MHIVSEYIFIYRHSQNNECRELFKIKGLLMNQLAKSACDKADRMKWVGERERKEEERTEGRNGDKGESPLVFFLIA